MTRAGADMVALAAAFIGTIALGLITLNLLPDDGSQMAVHGWIALVGAWLLAWRTVNVIALRFSRWRVSPLIAAVIFGLTLLLIWEGVVRGLNVPPVILPPPSMIASAIAQNLPMLWSDFFQTVIRSVLPGYAMGCGAAFLVAIAIDRSPFLQRGLLPVGNLAAALPIIGVAPIMVMWFGFDWHSKAAVVVLMTFFPMLVNTIQGLASSDAMHRDLMRTYAASYWQTLWMLRLPMAAPFIFNGLKICTTLALIGAIVAEFFGTPTVGMGFRISTEVGRLALDVVWAEIAVAALAGSAFYGVVTLLERAATFWHPSQRGGT